MKSDFRCNDLNKKKLFLDLWGEMDYYKENSPCSVVAHIKLCSGCEIFFYKFAVIVDGGCV